MAQARARHRAAPRCDICSYRQLPPAPPDWSVTGPGDQNPARSWIRGAEPPLHVPYLCHQPPSQACWWSECPCQCWQPARHSSSQRWQSQMPSWPHPYWVADSLWSHHSWPPVCLGAGLQQVQQTHEDPPGIAVTHGLVLMNRGYRGWIMLLVTRPGRRCSCWVSWGLFWGNFVMYWVVWNIKKNQVRILKLSSYNYVKCTHTDPE